MLISAERQRRRVLLAKQPLEARLAAVELIPQSTRQVGKKLEYHHREVLRLEAAATEATDAQTRDVFSQQLMENVKTLASLVSTAKKKSDRAKRALKPKTQEQSESEVIPFGILHPSIPRVFPLTLPDHWAVPPVAERIVLLRLLATQLQRLPQESDARLTWRLKVYTMRALARLVTLRAAGVTGSKALVQAATITLEEDAAAINAQSQTGRFELGPTLEAMQPLIRPLSAQFEGAIEDLQSGVPAEMPTAANVKELLRLASVLEAEAAQAPEEPSDTLVEDILLADETAESTALVPAKKKLAVKAAAATPLYENPIVVAGVVLGGLGLLWYTSSSRSA